MRRSDLRAIVAALAIGPGALAGCARDRGTVPPSPSSVEPAFADARSDTPVVIRGSGFQVKAVVEVGAAARVDAGYRAWLGALELADVQWIDAGTLRARVPAGLAPGVYDLVVEGPFGRGALANAMEILDGPALDARPSAPGAVGLLQEFDVALDVANAGSTAVSAAVAQVAPSGGIELVAGSAGAQDVPAHGSARWQWRFRGSSPGDALLAFSVQGKDARTGATVSATATGAVAVKRLASLAIVSLDASPDPANLAQDVFVEMVVSNAGDVDALAVAPTLAPDAAGAAAWLAGPTPPAAAIGPGGAATFAWRWAGAALGQLRFTGAAAGIDALVLTTVTAAPRGSAAITVQRPAALDGALVAPERVNLGQLFDVALAVSNLGDAVASAVRADLTISPAGLAAADPPPGAVDVAGASSTTFTRSFTAVGVGDGWVEAVATATDATDRRPLTLTRTRSLFVDLPADLHAVAALSPAGPLLPGPFELRMTVTNRGEAVARGVTPGTPAVLPGSTATVSPPVSGPTRSPDDYDLSENEAVTFSWTFDAVSAGTLGLGVSATAVDANDRAPLAVAPEIWTQVVPQPEAQDVAANALGDETPFAYVTAYGGDLVVGPTRRGTGLVRWDPTGAWSTALTLSFPRDGTGNQSANTATPPYRSIGYTGCPKNVVDGCGPDNEDGRGLLTSFTLAGSEWLLLAGARSAGEFSYVYVTRDAGPALSFSYVDLSALLGAKTNGISASRAVGDRLYLGFPDDGGARPYGTAVVHLPATGAGLDAVPNVDAIDLRLDQAFKDAIAGAQFKGIAMVDSFGDLDGRVYVLNDIGCIVSKIAAPIAPTDWANCSPAAAAGYDRTQSVAAPSQQSDIEPWQKAWPQVAVWNGRLYAIRNLLHPTLGNAPQLWSCDPSGGVDPAACEPGDWRLVAADATSLTRFGNANAKAASMLVATARHLYVGFDDAVGGVRVYRTSAATPLTRADFEGSGGCSAADDACPGFGGNGLGTGAATTRILDAKVLALGGRTFVYVSAGKGTQPARVVRLPE
jgi:hypothetical protein